MQNTIYVYSPSNYRRWLKQKLELLADISHACFRDSDKKVFKE